MTTTIVDILQSLRRGKSPASVAAFFEIPEASVHEVWNGLFDSAITAATIYPGEASPSSQTRSMAVSNIVVPEHAPAAPLPGYGRKSSRSHQSDPQPTPPKGGRRPRIAADQILKMFQDGLRVTDISQATGLTTATLSWRRRQFEDQGLMPVSPRRGQGKK